MASQTFWDPSFEITKRDDGTVLMQQVEPLAEALPTIADYLDLWADKAPDRTWLARRNDQGLWNTITYGQARDQAKRLGGALLALGLGPDRPLVILSGNSLEHGICGLACLYVGIPYAPLSTAYSLISQDHGKLRDITVLLQPGAFFADDTARYERAVQAVAGTNTAVIGVHNLIDGALDYRHLLNGSSAKDRERAESARAALTRETVLKYLFTSGSTGSPKAVISTNGNLTSNQAMVRDCYRFLETEPPIVLDWAPWNHTAAGSKLSYMILTNGGSYYIDDGKPTADGIETTVQNLRDIACTWYFNVPAGFDRLINALEADAELAQTFFSQLKMLFYAGAGMSQQTYDRLSAIARSTTGKDILISSSLGATETGPFTLTWTKLNAQRAKSAFPDAELL
jgi:feruloyl-CoA synthase